MMPKEHTSRVFDGELSHLHCLVLEMAGLVIDQLDLSLRALRERNAQLAEKVIQRDRDVDEHELKVDHEVLAVLAKRSPVANDLRRVISISKMVLDLELIGDEIVKVSMLTLSMFENNDHAPEHLLAEIVDLGATISTRLKQAIHSFDRCDVEGAYRLLEEKRKYDEEFRVGIGKQLNFITENPRAISRSLHVFQILRALEHCGERCRNISEYLVFICEGRDIRHRHDT